MGLTRAEQTLVPVPSAATLCPLSWAALCCAGAVHPTGSTVPGRNGAVRGFTGHRVHGRAKILCLGGSGMAKDQSLLSALPQH